MGHSQFEPEASVASGGFLLVKISLPKRIGVCPRLNFRVFSKPSGKEGDQSTPVNLPNSNDLIDYYLGQTLT